MYHPPGSATTFSRRQILGIGGMAAASLVGAAACGSGDSGGKKQLQLGTFASISSQFPIFEKLIKDYEKEHPDVTIRLQPMPAKSFYTQLDTRLAAGNAPDIVYMQHVSVGRYADAGALVDLTDQLGDGYADAFPEAFWRVVLHDDKVYGIPNQTNAFVIYYNKKHFKDAGITDVPASLDDAWNWEEFIDVAKRIKSKGVSKTPFAYNWTGNNGYRWLTILYMHGGRLLSDDLKHVEIDKALGVESIDWTKRWFTDGLVPATTSPKSGEDVTNLFSIGNISMMCNGAWVMPVLKERMKDEDWDVTFLFKDKEPANDFGGNSLTVTKDASDPETAADFIKFVANEANMEYYATQAQTIPTRKALQQKSLDYGLRPEEMNKVFLPSAGTVSTSLAAVQAIPEFGDFRTSFDNQLDLAFTSGQDAATTAKKIADDVRRAVEG